MSPACGNTYGGAKGLYMGISKRSFGTGRDGKAASLFEITNNAGTKLCVTDFGATVVSVFVKDKNGTVKDVVLGYDSANEYAAHTLYFGAVIGRNGNRIDNASFEIGGKTYTMVKNDGNNNLHSGPDGFEQRIWNAKTDESKNAVTFSLVSPDGDEGFPGNMNVDVTYTLTEDNGVEIRYEAVSDADTVANMTNHSYFNLAGHETGIATSSKLWLNADGFTPVRQLGLIPTGEITPVKDTPLDFTTMQTVADRIEDKYPQMVFAGGYDHNFALNVKGGTMEKIATMCDKDELITMDVYTDCVGVQFYSGNFITPHTGKGGAQYVRRGGLCLETQFFPNAINQPKFASPLLKAGQKYSTTTIYRFR